MPAMEDSIKCLRLIGLLFMAISLFHFGPAKPGMTPRASAHGSPDVRQGPTAPPTFLRIIPDAVFPAATYTEDPSGSSPRLDQP